MSQVVKDFSFVVIPAKAGIHAGHRTTAPWTPAFAGVTRRKAGEATKEVGAH